MAHFLPKDMPEQERKIWLEERNRRKREEYIKSMQRTMNRNLMLIDGALEFHINKDERTATVGIFEKYRVYCKEIVTPSVIKVYDTDFIIDEISCFQECEKLESVKINDGPSILPLCAFRNCSELKSLYLPSSLKKISLTALSACNKLEKISFADLSVINLTEDLFNKENRSRLKFEDRATGKIITYQDYFNSK